MLDSAAARQRYCHNDANAGQPWATDAPLRQGMSALRLATAALIVRGVKASKPEYDALAKRVTREARVRQVGLVLHEYAAVLPPTVRAGLVNSRKICYQSDNYS